MGGFPVTCECGYQLRDVFETPCPKCGSVNRNVALEARGGAKATGRAQMTRRKMDVQISKNWPVMVVLILCNVTNSFASRRSWRSGAGVFLHCRFECSWLYLPHENHHYHYARLGDCGTICSIATLSVAIVMTGSIASWSRI